MTNSFGKISASGSSKSRRSESPVATQGGGECGPVRGRLPQEHPVDGCQDMVHRVSGRAHNDAAVRHEDDSGRGAGDAVEVLTEELS